LDSDYYNNSSGIYIQSALPTDLSTLERQVGAIDTNDNTKIKSRQTKNKILDADALR